MKAVIRVNRDTGTGTHSRGDGEATLLVQGRGKAAVVILQLSSPHPGRTVEFELKEFQSALKGLELSVK